MFYIYFIGRYFVFGFGVAAWVGLCTAFFFGIDREAQGGIFSAGNGWKLILSWGGIIIVGTLIPYVIAKFDNFMVFDTGLFAEKGEYTSKVNAAYAILSWWGLVAYFTPYDDDQMNSYVGALTIVGLVWLAVVFLARELPEFSKSSSNAKTILQNISEETDMVKLERRSRMSSINPKFRKAYAKRLAELEAKALPRSKLH